MNDPYVVRALRREQIAQAFTLVRLLDPGLTLDRWWVYASQFVGAGQNARRGILAAQNEQGYIHGLAFYRIGPDLRHDRILEVENFVTFDLTGGRRAASTLLTGVETWAQRQRCCRIRLCLLDPKLRQALRDPANPQSDLFQTAGYEDEPFHLGKSLSAVPPVAATQSKAFSKGSRY